MKPGISILECMIYLAGISILIIGLWEIMIPYLFFSRKIQDSTQKAIDLVIALNRIAEDVSKAPLIKELWPLQGVHEIIWKRSGTYYGWSIEKNKLIRKEGSYSQQRWDSAIKTTVLSGIKNLEFYFNENKTSFAGITCFLATSHFSCQKYIAFNNKRILVCNS